MAWEIPRFARSFQEEKGFHLHEGNESQGRRRTIIGCSLVPMTRPNAAGGGSPQCACQRPRSFTNQLWPFLVSSSIAEINEIWVSG